jgi:hypothetical protein
MFSHTHVRRYKFIHTHPHAICTHNVEKKKYISFHNTTIKSLFLFFTAAKSSTHTHTHAHTQTHPPTHPPTHPHTHSLTHPPTHPPTHPRTHTRTHTRTHPQETVSRACEQIGPLALAALNSQVRDELNLLVTF